jgi:hypothetical protein
VGGIGCRIDIGLPDVHLSAACTILASSRV